MNTPSSPFTKFELLELLLLGTSTARPARSESMDDDLERCDAEAVVTALSARYRFSDGAEQDEYSYYYF